MILYVKNSANFTLKNLKTLMYLKLNTHTHTHTQKYCITTIFYLFQFGNFVKTTLSICPRVKVFYDLKNLSEGINKAEYGRNMPKETKNRSRWSIK
jgi:hypothetical protein